MKWLFVVVVLMFSVSQENFLPELTEISSSPSEIRPLTRLGNGLGSDVAWSPDESVVAVSTSIGLYLYNARNLAAAPVQLNTEAKSFGNLVFSPTGDVLAVGDGHLELWDIKRRAVMHTIDTGGAIISKAFSPDGSKIVTSTRLFSDNREVIIWDVYTGEKLQVLNERLTAANLTYSPDGTMIAGISVADCCFTPYIWDANTGEKIYSGDIDIAEQRADIETLAFTADSSSLIVSDSFENTAIWNIATEEMQIIETPDSEYLPPTLKNAVSGIQFNADRTRIAFVTYNGTVGIWDIATNEVIAQREGSAFSSMIEFSPDGKLLASGSQLVNVETGEVEFVLDETEMTTLAFSPDSEWLAVGNRQGEVRLWDMEKRRFDRILTKRETPIKFIAFAQSEILFLHVVSEDNLFEVYNLSTNKPFPIYTLDPDSMKIESQMIVEEPFSFSGIVTGDMGTIYIGDISGGLYWWSSEVLSSFKLIAKDYFNRAIHAIALRGSERQVAVAGEGQVVQLYTMYTGEFIANLTTHNSWIYALDFSPDDILLASGGCSVSSNIDWDGWIDCGGGEVRLWDFGGRLGRYQMNLPKVHTDIVKDIEFNSDGTLLATASDDGTIMLWGVPEER